MHPQSQNVRYRMAQQASKPVLTQEEHARIEASAEVAAVGSESDGNMLVGVGIPVDAAWLFVWVLRVVWEGHLSLMSSLFQGR